MTQLVQMLAVLILGPMVGVEFAVAAFFNPIVGRLPDSAFRAARSDGARLLGRVMPFWYAAALVLLVAVGVVAAPQRGIIGVAAALLVAIMLVTVTLLVPINNRIAAGEATAELTGRWDRLHWGRVALLGVVLVLLVIAVR